MTGVQQLARYMPAKKARRSGDQNRFQRFPQAAALTARQRLPAYRSSQLKDLNGSLNFELTP